MVLISLSLSLYPLDGGPSKPPRAVPSTLNPLYIYIYTYAAGSLGTKKLTQEFTRSAARDVSGR